MPACRFRCPRGLPFFEQDVKIAAAGLSDDSLPLLMEEQAVATNMYRRMGKAADHVRFHTPLFLSYAVLLAQGFSH